MNGERTIGEAELEWGAPGDGDAPSSFAPRSSRFGDVYFETRHVFLGGNDLPARFNTRHFSIGELGFGTGLNFLATWDAWTQAKRPDGARLQYFSIEAFPLAAADLKRAHQAWPEFAGRAEELRRNLPPAHPGFHHLNLGDVALTLFYGDVSAGLACARGGVDAWFLDGFSPAKNPAMWSAEVFSELARLSNPGATFATFTVSGAVRRALEAASFTWEKRPGYGRKKEMLAGAIGTPPQEPEPAPWFAKASAPPAGAQIAIIGGGIAGASLAYCLRAAGFRPTVFEARAAASGASGNPAGLIMPRLDAGDTPAGKFHALAYLHTTRLLSQFDDAIFDPCGVIHHATNDKDRERQARLVAQDALPKGWIETHREGLFFPQAGVVDPPRFVRALLSDAPLIAEKVTRLKFSNGKWSVYMETGEMNFDAVVIANGLDALRFAEARTLPLSGSAGQIDYFPEAEPPEHAHAFGPYAAPAPNGGAIIGATYAPIAIGAEARFTLEATNSNIAAVARTLPAFAATLNAVQSLPRASIRCTTPDRLPVAGPVPDWGFYGAAYDDLRTGKRRQYPRGEMRPGLFILTGLGSRGLVTAPYAAALIAAEMSGAPTDSTILQALHPARFFIRDLKRAGGR